MGIEIDDCEIIVRLLYLEIMSGVTMEAVKREKMSRKKEEKKRKRRNHLEKNDPCVTKLVPTLPGDSLVLVYCTELSHIGC